MQTIMTLLLWFSLSVSGISRQGKSVHDGVCFENYLLNLEDFNSMEKPKVTDLQMESLFLDATLVLDATLFAAFAPLAAMFFPLAAMFDAANDRGSAQPGLSPVVLPPPPPGFVLGGNGICLDRCPRLLSVMLVDYGRDDGMLRHFDGGANDCCDDFLPRLGRKQLVLFLEARLISRRNCPSLVLDARADLARGAWRRPGVLLFFSKQSSALSVLGMKFLERFIVHAFWAKMGTTLILWESGV